MRVPGAGRLVLLGGGEFTFGETEEVDRVWIGHCRPGAVGFLPTASGSTEYGDHFAAYLRETFDREVETVPIYRPRDARRGRNSERIEEAAAVYLGGGLADHVLDTLRDTPALETLGGLLDREGGLVVAIAAAAQCLGAVVRSPTGRDYRVGFGWLPRIAIETNFDPDRPRRLEQAVAQPGVLSGLAIAAGSAVVLGPGDAVAVHGAAWTLERDGELEDLESS